jgi:hypothetical protein
VKELKELQDAFYEAIFNPNTDTITAVSQLIPASEALSQEARISIYRDSILGGITSGLGQLFPVCVKLVGEKYFTHMVSGYLKQHASDTPDLGNYGEHLAAYISTFAPAKDLIYLADVAQLEWLWHRAFNAQDSDNNKDLNQQIKPISELETVDADSYPTVRLQLVHSAYLHASPYPIHKIWEVNQEDYQGNESISLDEGGEQLLVWKKTDFSMKIDVLSHDEYIFLSALNEHKTLSELTELPLTQAIEVIFQRCLNIGVILGFTLPT